MSCHYNINIIRDNAIITCIYTKYLTPSGIDIKPDDYLFQPQHLNRVTAHRNLARQFDIILEAANLKIGDKGINRSIYSMRHTSLLFAAKRNTSISRDALASNARTSTLMLEKHYLSTLENEDLANALHARDSGKKVK